MSQLLKNKFIVGLTGGIGSGKSTVTNILTELGIDIVDADIVAREIVAPNSKALTAIAKHFGEGFILASGELDRSRLRQHIFAQPHEKDWLNNLLHPMIREEILRQLSQTRSAYCVLVAPLLFENNLHTQVDHVIVVDVCEETQIKRTCARDNNTREEVQRIINAQISRKERLDGADTVICNDIDLTNKMNDIRQKVVEIDKKLQKLVK